MPAVAPPFAPVSQCDDFCSSTSDEEALVVREPWAEAHGVWKLAAVAVAATGLIAAAGTWRGRSESVQKGGGRAVAGRQPPPSRGLSLAPRSAHGRRRRKARNSQRVAVLTSGTLKRYLLTQAAEGLVQPLAKQGYVVDYYAALSVANFSAWNGKADDFVPEVSTRIFGKVKGMVEKKIQAAGGHVRSLGLLRHVKLSDRDRAFIKKGLWNVDYFDPLRGVHARTNVVKMLKPLRGLGERMEKVEAKHGKYDYVIIAKDDTIWLKPFSLKRLLTQRTLSDPGGYVLRCDEGLSTYSPPSNTSLTEYIFVLKRNSSTPFYMMHKVLVDGGLDGKRRKKKEVVQKYWDAHNLENFAKRLADDSHIKLQRTPPFLLPMQRAGRLNVDGEVKTCLHKCCDSSRAGVPLLQPRSYLPMCQGPLEPYRLEH